MREDDFTSTVEGAAAYERMRGMTDDYYDDARADALADAAWEGADLECPNDDCPEWDGEGPRPRWNSGYIRATRYEPADCRYPECPACGTEGMPL